MYPSAAGSSTTPGRSERRSSYGRRLSTPSSSADQARPPSSTPPRPGRSARIASDSANRTRGCSPPRAERRSCPAPRTQPLLAPAEPEGRAPTAHRSSHRSSRRTVNRALPGSPPLRAPSAPSRGVSLVRVRARDRCRSSTSHRAVRRPVAPALVELGSMRVALWHGFSWGEPAGGSLPSLGPASAASALRPTRRTRRSCRRCRSGRIPMCRRSDRRSANPSLRGGCPARGWRHRPSWCRQLRRAHRCRW